MKCLRYTVDSDKLPGVRRDESVHVSLYAAMHSAGDSQWGVCVPLGYVKAFLVREF